MINRRSKLCQKCKHKENCIFPASSKQCPLIIDGKWQKQKDSFLEAQEAYLKLVVTPEANKQ